MRRLDSWINRSGPLRYATKCRRQNPQHTKLNCPMYECCLHCKGSGAYGYLNKHRCTAGEEDMVSLGKGNDCDYHTCIGMMTDTSRQSWDNFVPEQGAVS